MGSNSRYADHIDRDVERRRAMNTPAARPTTPSAFHARLNAFPDRWVCRNGRWGDIYGRIEARDVMRNMLWTTVYYATFTKDVEEPMGEFATGDEAATELWNRYLTYVTETSPRRRD
ncbi:hypothetical protein PYV02_14855 [Leifsonia sp. H3M29-4]|uniref:hypothetical protein n=1 Tax=Salinibacterium metalliresistens TaxID=3031321 RepID=UPI0023DBE896|nr:hypothetical protein [Salinibacterium metalliresistens]MDF1480362.1 hypothetical protein [Salinibacterium metalliresistens]